LNIWKPYLQFATPLQAQCYATVMATMMTQRASEHPFRPVAHLYSLQPRRPMHETLRASHQPAPLPVPPCDTVIPLQSRTHQSSVVPMPTCRSWCRHAGADVDMPVLMPTCLCRCQHAGADM